MAADRDSERVLRLYPDDCQALDLQRFITDEAFSGANLWRVSSPRGPLCLRQWPAAHPTSERLEFIQAVLWHVHQEGFSLVPLPLETRHHHGYVRHNGHLWELTPWMPGLANFRSQASLARLDNALLQLASFHRAARSFPLPDTGPMHSPGIMERRTRLHELMTGRATTIRKAVRQSEWPEMAERARNFFPLFEQVAPSVGQLLASAGELRISIQPCIRDIWHAHVLFEGDRVSGIVDFGSMRAENVATDVARLLGSLVGDDLQLWQRGLNVYQTVRPISADEHQLVTAFDRSSVLLSGIQWLEWVYLDGKTFANRGAVLSRIDELLARLAHQAKSI